MKVWSAPIVGILLLFVLSAVQDAEGGHLLLKKGLKILAPIALVAGGAGAAGGFAGALLARHHKQPSHHTVKHVHHHPVHHVKVVEHGWDHGWKDEGWKEEGWEDDGWKDEGWW